MSRTQHKQSNVKQHIALTEHYFGLRKMFLGELLYFGYEAATAQSRALRVMSLVTELKAKGLKRWTPEHLKMAKAIAKGEDNRPAANNNGADELPGE
ncbi:MAG: hypothetical protein ABIP55_16700 [Tepidisphaeraceae bacterium]